MHFLDQNHPKATNDAAKKNRTASAAPSP